MEKEYLINVSYMEGDLNFRDIERVLGCFVKIDRLRAGERNDGIINLYYPTLIDNGDINMLENLTKKIYAKLSDLSVDDNLYVKINPFK